MRINLDKKQVRTFGLMLAAILIVFGVLQFYKDRHSLAYVLYVSGVISAASALFFQPVIKPIYIIMMKMAHVLGWINTRILLGLLFYIILTPTGLLMRMFGRDILDQNINPDSKDYWIKKEKIKFTKKSYENQY